LSAACITMLPSDTCTFLPSSSISIMRPVAMRRRARPACRKDGE
jgi:hypothetical protein